MKMQPLAVITEAGTPGSVELHEQFGFRPIGTLEAVGIKHDQWIDTFLMNARSAGVRLRSLSPRQQYRNEPARIPARFAPFIYGRAGRDGVLAMQPPAHLPGSTRKGSARRLLKAQPVVAVM